MIEPVSIESLKEAIESMHGGTATFVQTVPVRERFEGATVWEGVVQVFSLADNNKADRAFAWSSPMEGVSRQIYAVLAIPPITSPIEAVRASIVAGGALTLERLLHP
ncbi:MAG TPA: hypothetical protein VHS33_10110 [Sphingomicrobium sp.]|jgi:hypothetical protein|nr:hypothetical protein [Sphingomicrobium sp.]